MTKETPGKIMALLCTAMMSMFFMFAVTVTNASFSGTETVPLDPFSPTKVVSLLNKDPFGPQNVMAILDSVSSGYSKFLAANLFTPAKTQLAYYQDTGRYVIDQASDPIMAMTGLTNVSSEEYYQKLDQTHYASLYAPRVAGAYTEKGQDSNLSFKDFFAFLSER